MTYKPMPVNKYKQLLKVVGWKLQKGKVDWNLYNQNGEFICSIIVAHGKRTKTEITALSVNKTAQKFKERGLLWPPKK